MSIQGSISIESNPVKKPENNELSWITNLSRLQRIGELLVSAERISREDLKKALDLSTEKRIRLGEALQELNVIKEVDILKTFGENLGMPVLHPLDIKVLEKYKFDHSFFARFSEDVIDKLGILPIRLDVRREPGKTTQYQKFTFIVNDPWQYPDVKRIAEDFSRREREESIKDGKMSGASMDVLSDMDIKIEIIGMLAQKNEIMDTIAEARGRAQSSISTMAVASSLVKDDTEEAATKAINEIIGNAIQNKATDIHITPLHRNGGLWVRYRIDGELEDALRNGRYAVHDYNLLLNRSLIMSKIDHTEKRKPQSGSFQFTFNRNIYDIRVETIPTTLTSLESGGESLDGSKILFRILYKETSLAVNELGFSSDDLMILKKMYTKPSGVLLVTGPTSSGKTTTIYSIIRSLDADKQSVYTVEDPVEYFLEGATQVPVSEKEGRSFAAVLKSLMRLDPNIVFMGEMRDPESARTAMQIANTGHSVFSTVHTNSAYTAPTRLVSMGIEPYLVLGNLNGVLAQRLVRANCKTCSKKYVPSERTLLNIGLDKDKTYYKGTGRINQQVCPHCNGEGQINGQQCLACEGMGVVGGDICPNCKGIGLKGRLGIFEIMPLCEYQGWEKYMNEPLKLREFFRDRGHGDLIDDAKRKMLQGLLSPDSLYGVLTRMEVVLEDETQRSA